MSDITEGVGAAIEGGMASRAVEPAHGENAALNANGDAVTTCKNCGSEVTGEHCSACGQKRHIHSSLAAIAHDLIHGVLHLDGKLWRTLPMLVFKPGQLTRRYIDGERAKFVSPMAMFLFTVFMMFAVFQIAGISTPTTLPESTNVYISLDEAQEQVIADRDAAAEALENMPTGSPGRLAAEIALREAEEAVKGINTVDEMVPDAAGPSSLNGTGIDAFDEGIIKKWNENPGLMLYKLQNNAYKFSWLLIPLSIPFVWILFFWKRRFKAYDHAIFVTYSLAFMSMLFIIVSMLILAGVSEGWIVLITFLIPPVHIYRQLKGAYNLSHFSAFWRTSTLLSMIMLPITFGFAWLLLMIGAF